MEKDEANGVPAADVAGVVGPASCKLSGRGGRVSVGKIDERVGIVGKRLLPYRIFEWAAKSSLGV